MYRYVQFIYTLIARLLSVEDQLSAEYTIKLTSIDGRGQSLSSQSGQTACMGRTHVSTYTRQQSYALS